MQHMLFCLLSVATGVVYFVELITVHRRLLVVRAFFLVMTGSWFLTMATMMKTGYPLVVLEVEKDWTYKLSQRQAPDGVLMMLNASLFTQLAMTWLVSGVVVYAVIRFIMVRRGKLRVNHSTLEYDPVKVVPSPQVHAQVRSIWLRCS